MIKLYRAVSQSEKEDLDRCQLFRTNSNTLEAKQFFMSTAAVRQFVDLSRVQDYIPPYIHLLIINIDAGCLNRAEPAYMNLDGFNAVNISERDLSSFNNCVLFFKQALL